MLWLIASLVGACSGEGGVVNSGGPNIQSVDPLSGSVGTAVVIYGNGFSANLELDDVRFGNVQATVTTASSTALSTVVPPGALTGRVTVSVGGKTATSASDFVVIAAGTTAKGPTIVTQPTSLTVIEGQTASFDVVATGTAPLAYQWAFGGRAISGATSASFTIASATTTAAGSYSVKVSNAAGSVVSDAATLTVAARGGGAVAPSITKQPVGLTVAEGGSASFSVTATGTAPLAYQWALDGQAISGATSATYAIGSVAATAAGSYTVKVSNVAGSVVSGAATLTVTAGRCDEGVATTVWASNCPSSQPSCAGGSWVEGGPDSDHASYKKLAESAHFVVYSDENPAGVQGVVDYLETVWNTYFGPPIYMREPMCESSVRYKNSIHVNSNFYYASGSISEPGRMAMWLQPSALTARGTLAHEFMHGVQAVEGGMQCAPPAPNTCGWVWESDANWHVHQMSEFNTTDVGCSELLVNSTHLYLGSTRDRYCNWQFLEFLKNKYCYSATNGIWTGAPAKDPFTGIMNAQGWSLSQLNDFFGEWAMHNVTWDYQNVAPQSTVGQNQGALFRSKYGLVTDTSRPERLLRLTELESLDGNWATNRRFVSPYFWAPQRWGYNIIRLYPDPGATSVTVTFRGVIQTEANSDFRWGLVATDAAIATPRYSQLKRGTDGQLNFCVKPGEPLFLVVMGTPSVQQQIVWDQAYSSIFRYPYMIQLDKAWPAGFQKGQRDPCPPGTSRVANGGGCGPANLPSSVYVGPYAKVLGGTVTGNARIEDHATIVSGTVSSGTVGAMTVITNSFNVSTSGKVQATFYPLGYFANGQGVSGSASLVGDVEYGGQGLNRSSGTCSGYVDSATCASGAAEVTVAPPYSWR